MKTYDIVIIGGGPNVLKEEKKAREIFRYRLPKCKES